MNTSSIAAGVCGMSGALDNEGEQGRAALRQLILVTMRQRHPEPTGSDDIDHDLVAAVSPASWGAAFGGLRKSGEIAEVGVRRSRRPEARGRLVRVYRLAEAGTDAVQNYSRVVDSTSFFESCPEIGPPPSSGEGLLCCDTTTSARPMPGQEGDSPCPLN